jgi:hypothetical protein
MEFKTLKAQKMANDGTGRQMTERDRDADFRVIMMSEGRGCKRELQKERKNTRGEGRR